MSLLVAFFYSVYLRLNYESIFRYRCNHKNNPASICSSNMLRQVPSQSFTSTMLSSAIYHISKSSRIFTFTSHYILRVFLDPSFWRFFFLATSLFLPLLVFWTQPGPLGSRPFEVRSSYSLSSGSTASLLKVKSTT